MSPRVVEFVGSRPFLSPGDDDLAAFGDLPNACFALAAMPIGDEDISVRRNRHGRRLVECIFAGPSYSGFAEREQDLSLWTELENLMALAVFRVTIGDPYISVAVRGDAVRKDEHSRAEAGEMLPGVIEVQNRRQI